MKIFNIYEYMLQEVPNTFREQEHINKIKESDIFKYIQIGDFVYFYLDGNFKVGEVVDHHRYDFKIQEIGKPFYFSHRVRYNGTWRGGNNEQAVFPLTREMIDDNDRLELMICLISVIRNHESTLKETLDILERY